MNKQYKCDTGAIKEVRVQHPFGNALLDTLRSLFQPAPSQDVGMFAGSLLPSADWAQPKVPH